MAETSYPYRDQEITDAQYSDFARDYVTSGVVKRTPNGTDLQVSANSTGMEVTVAAGRANLRGHRYKNDASKKLTIEPKDDYPRIDTVCVRSEYGSEKSAKLVVKKGKPTVPPTAPVAPDIEQSAEGIWEEALSDVAVSASTVTIAPGNVSDRRKLVLPATAVDSKVGSTFLMRRKRQQLNVDNGTVPLTGDLAGLFDVPEASTPMALVGNAYANDVFKFDRADGSLRVLVSGYYDLSAQVQYNTNTQGTMVLALLKNQSTITGTPGNTGGSAANTLARHDIPSSATALPWARVSARRVFLTPTDYVRLVSYTTSQGGTLAMGTYNSPSAAEWFAELKRIG